MAITDIVINVLLGRVTRHPAGMHCPSWDDAFVSSFCLFVGHDLSPEHRAFEGCIVRTRIALPFVGQFRRGLKRFYARRLSVERSYSDVAGWVAGWLSVTAGIVSKRLNVSENFFDHLIAPS